MRIRVLISILFLCLIQTLSGKKYEGKPEWAGLFMKAEQWYLRAEQIAVAGGDEAASDQLNKLALSAYLQLLNMRLPDSTLFTCWNKIGILEHSAGQLDSALLAYSQAIRIQAANPAISDSLLFEPLLYSGNINYAYNRFDSAVQYFRLAENIAGKYPGQKERARLYNILGALSYESGNYRQSRNYFSKALASLQRNNPDYNSLYITYRNNLGRALQKLELFDEAIAIFNELLRYPGNNFRNEILHNIGIINLSLGSVKKALDFFRQVNYPGSGRASLYVDMGKAFLNLNQYDSADFYLKKAIAGATTGFEKKSIDYGMAMKYAGDLLMEQRRITEAVASYHTAIIALDYSFNDTSTAANPRLFAGAYSAYNLFDALVAKARALEYLSAQSGKDADLISALAAFQSAFRLADYVERSYEIDEARLLLNSRKYLVHSQPIAICLKLFERTGQQQYLEYAYDFDEQNKAATLSINLQELQLRQISGVPQNLLDEESATKTQLTRLTLKAAHSKDSAQLAQLAGDISDLEIKLAALSEKLNGYPEYRRLKYSHQTLGTGEVREKLLPDASAAILSYHIADSNILCFILTKKGFTHFQTPGKDSIIEKVTALYNSLRQEEGESDPADAGRMAFLYQRLIAPALGSLKGISRLVIIPDDELYYLPFEMLQNSRGEYLINQFSIGYNYSCTLLAEGLNTGSPARRDSILAMAPFAGGAAGGFAALGDSRTEVEGLKGKVLLNGQASKAAFLAQAAQYQILHLATHAQANDNDPLQSFISFYPPANDSDFQYKLYANEIYNLPLGQTSLVILSACETGGGQLIKGEGIMSLSRAFSYAGCANSITSLWKADDAATAYIAKRLHRYIQNGLPYDQALRRAKLDFLNDSQIEPRRKQPAYWAHLRLIGYLPPEKTNSRWIWMLAAGLLVLVIVWIRFRRMKKNEPM